MKTIFLITSIVFVIGNSQAQRVLDSLNYNNTQDIHFFRNVKNRTLVKKYTTVNNNVIQVADTVILGNPTSQNLTQEPILGVMVIQEEWVFLILEVPQKKPMNLSC